MRRKILGVFIVLVCVFGIGTASVYAVTGSEIVNDLISNYVGKYPYVYGTHGPNSFDCSGLVYYVYSQHGIYLSATTDTDWTQYGTVITDTSQLKDGDILLFGESWSNLHHMGIYDSNGGYIIQALNSTRGIIREPTLSTWINSPGWNSYGWNNFQYAVRVLSGSNDTTPPTITSLIVTNKSTSSFTINCTANETLSKAYIIIYNSTYPNGIGLNVNNINSASFSKTINTSEYGGGDTFAAHIYVYDTVGNAAIGKTGEFSLTNIAVNSLTVSNITDSGFTLNCTANQKISRAYVIIYNSTYPNGRGFNIDNINNKSFSKTITASDYGGGNTFAAHIYIYDTLGNAAIGKTGEFSLTNIAVANFTVSNITDNSFTLNCTASQKISRAYLIIYNSTYPNGAGLNVNNINSNSFSKQINISDYGGTGEYSVHVYVYDSSDNSASGKTGKFYVPQSLANTSTATTATRSIGRIEVQTKIYNLSQNASCIAAVYSVDGALLGQTANNVNSSTNSVSAYFPNYSNASYVKVFLWDSLEGMKPLTNGEKVTL